MSEPPGITMGVTCWTLPPASSNGGPRMETVSTWRTLVQSAMVLAALISSGASKAQAPDANSPAVEKSLKGFLRTLDDNKATLYIAAFRDLNGDGMPEAVVYLMGKSWCGSGGCNTLILAANGNSWRIATNITITPPP